MKLISALLVVTLTGCASTAIMRAEYVKDGTDTKQVRADKNLCASEGIQVWKDTPGGADISSYFMQKHFYECMKAKGYDAVGISPDVYKNKF